MDISINHYVCDYRRTRHKQAQGSKHHFAIRQDETFDTYGLDSLNGIAVVNRFEEDLGKLPSTIIFAPIIAGTPVV